MAIPELEVHPSVLRMYNELTGDERQQLQNSIVEMGVQEPVRIWRNPETGRDVIVGGRNRYLLLRDAIQKGLISENDPKAELPTLSVGDMTPAQVQEYIMSTGAGRVMSASQKAVAAVVHLAEIAKMNGGKITTHMMDKAHEEFRVNSDYLYKAKSLLADEKLLNMVRDGELVIEDAVARLEARGKKKKGSAAQKRADRAKRNASKDAAESGEGSETTEEEQLPTLTDGLGGEILPDDPLYEEFRARDLFKVIGEPLKRLTQMAAQLHADPGGDFLNIDRIDELAQAIRAEFKQHKPHAKCPACGATGKDDPKNEAARKKCQLCKGAKYVDIPLYTAWENEQKASSSENGNGNGRGKKGRGKKVEKESEGEIGEQTA